MKKIICFLAVFIINNTAYSYIYYGIPKKTDISIGSKIITNLPVNGRFEDPIQLNDLITLLNDNPNFAFHIEINSFMGTDKYCQAYSEVLCYRLEQELNERCKYQNYQLFANGNTKPIFFSDDKAEYLGRNNRIEIIVKAKE